MQRSIGAALKAARLQAGLTQTAVSKSAGLGPGQLSQIESGKSSSPEFATVAKLAVVLGISLDVIAAECGFRVDPSASEMPKLLRYLTSTNDHIAIAKRAQETVTAELSRAAREIQAALQSTTGTKEKRKGR